eukprot:s3359_g1.t1
MRAIALLEGILETLQPGLKQNVLEKGDESEPMRAIALLEGILETLQPGGAAEMQSLQSFVRNLKPVNTAKGLSVLRRWRLARSRAVALALPQVAPFEELGALGTLALNLEKRHDRLREEESVMKVLSGLEEPGPVPDPTSDSEESRPSDVSSEGNSGEEESVDSIPDAGGPLWILDLTLRDYIHLTRPAQIQVCADRDFREEENPHAITWAVWDAIIHDELDTDESGTIPIVEDVCMIKCDTTVVFCEDGVGRPCFVVWIQEESTGRERHVALAQFRYRPRVQRWPAIPDPNVPERRRKEVAKDKPGHTLDDYKARGNKKPHRRVQPSDVAKGVLSIDIARPYKGAYDDSKYILAGVFRLEDGATLQFVQPLQRKFWSDVLIGVRAILNELSAIAGGHAPVRIHSDRAKEFLAQRVVEEIKGAGIHQTCTVGHDPAANGVAERNIGLLKQRVREFLIKGEAP